MMIGLLLFISFLLHAAAFYWIYQLKGRLQGGTEVEGVLAVYLDEMKEENDKLIRRLRQLETGETVIEKKTFTDALAESEANHSGNTMSQETYNPPANLNETEDRVDSSLEAQALFLAEQGLGHEEIAKKLGRGKGEVELLIRLAAKKKTK